MTKAKAMILFIGGLLVVPMAYGADSATQTHEAVKASNPAMSDMMHKKTMGGGMHHPDSDEQAAPVESDKAGDQPVMSDMMHKKTMGGGMHHPEKP